MPEKFEGGNKEGSAEQKNLEQIEIPSEPIPEKIINDANSEREASKSDQKTMAELRENIEGEFDKAPTKQEIFELLGVGPEKLIGEPKEDSDDKGIKRLEFKVEGKEKGQVNEYLYARDMKSTEGAPHFGKLETDIYETIYDENGDFVKFPENILRYKDGKWEKV